MLKYKKNNYSQKKSCNSKVIEDALKTLREIQQEAQINGTSEMTLEGINLEIYAARRERESKDIDMRKLLLEIGEEAKLNGTSEMTLEEINAEIATARRDIDARRKNIRRQSRSTEN